MKLEIETYATLKQYIRPERYLDCLKMLHSAALSHIRKKSRVRLAFQAAFLSTWIGDEIVKMFSANKRFDVTVVLTWQMNADKEYELGCLERHFKESKIKYVVADGSVKPGDFDIIIYTSPYLFELENFYDVDIPLSTLVCYVPYGFYLAKIQGMQFNQFIHNIAWKNYVGSKGYPILAGRYCEIGDYGMIYSGYPKMDALLRPNINGEFKWKVNGDKKSVKKIIYAPHHSINEIPWQSTFPQNFEFMLEFARNHQETTSWVFKPHPLLKLSCIKNGVFGDEKGFDRYCAEWDSLPNGRYVDGEYLSVFATSDAMIFDSASFMVEYLYVGKPSLFLCRDGVSFNEFGEIVYDCLYKVEGADFEGIEDFINTLIERDPQKKEREAVFKQILDYAGENGASASEFIYKDILKELEV